MTPLTLGITALVLGLLIGGSVVVGAPVFAIPIVLLALGAMGLLHMRRRAEAAADMEEFRHQAAAEKVEFTERDRQTTV